MDFSPIFEIGKLQPTMIYFYPSLSYLHQPLIEIINSPYL